MWIISNDFTERAATTIFGSQAWWWRWSRRWWWHQRRLTMVLGEAKQRICVVPVANGRPRVRWKYNRRLCWIFVPNSWSKMKRPLPLPCWSAQLKDSHLDLQSQTFMFRFNLFSHIGGKVYWNKLHKSSCLRWNGKDLFVLTTWTKIYISIPSCAWWEFFARCFGGVLWEKLVFFLPRH